jgi:hypothetical protein
MANTPQATGWQTTPAEELDRIRRKYQPQTTPAPSVDGASLQSGGYVPGRPQNWSPAGLPMVNPSAPMTTAPTPRPAMGGMPGLSGAAGPTGDRGMESAQPPSPGSNPVSGPSAPSGPSIIDTAPKAVMPNPAENATQRWMKPRDLSPQRRYFWSTGLVDARATPSERNAPTDFDSTFGPNRSHMGKPAVTWTERQASNAAGQASAATQRKLPPGWESF